MDPIVPMLFLAGCLLQAITFSMGTFWRKRTWWVFLLSKIIVAESFALIFFRLSLPQLFSRQSPVPSAEFPWFDFFIFSVYWGFNSIAFLILLLEPFLYVVKNRTAKMSAEMILAERRRLAKRILGELGGLLGVYIFLLQLINPFGSTSTLTRESKVFLFAGLYGSIIGIVAAMLPEKNRARNFLMSVSAFGSSLFSIPPFFLVRSLVKPLYAGARDFGNPDLALREESANKRMFLDLTVISFAFGFVGVYFSDLVSHIGFWSLMVIAVSFVVSVVKGEIHLGRRAERPKAALFSRQIISPTARKRFLLWFIIAMAVVAVVSAVLYSVMYLERCRNAPNPETCRAELNRTLRP